MSTGGRRPRFRLAVLLPSPLVASGVGTTGTSCEGAASATESAAVEAPAPGEAPPAAAALLRPRRLIGALQPCELASFAAGGVAAPSLRRRSSIASRRAGGATAGSQRLAAAVMCMWKAR